MLEDESLEEYFKKIKKVCITMHDKKHNLKKFNNKDFYNKIIITSIYDTLNIQLLNYQVMPKYHVHTSQSMEMAPYLSVMTMLLTLAKRGCTGDIALNHVEALHPCM